MKFVPLFFKAKKKDRPGAMDGYIDKILDSELINWRTISSFCSEIRLQIPGIKVVFGGSGKEKDGEIIFTLRFWIAKLSIFSLFSKVFCVYFSLEDKK